MSNQTLNLGVESQLIESNLFKLDWESSLLFDDELDTSSSDRAIAAEASTEGFDLFTDSEGEISPLYSTSLAMNGNDRNVDDDRESQTPLDETTESTDTGETTEESDLLLTNSITVGDPDGTEFTFNFAEGTPQEVIDGVREAGENWSAVLADDVDVNIDFTFEPDDTELGLLGFNVSEYIPFSYTGVYEALAEDVTSVNDETAVDNLAEDNLDILINNTSENNGSDTPYLDDNNGFNNSNVLLTRANAKALGIGLEDLAEEFGVSVEEIVELINSLYPELALDPNAADATMNFSSNVNWDFDASDGISEDAYDFVGVVTHEIGHALGFESSADALDFVADPDLDLADAINSPEIQELIAGTDAELFADAVGLDQFVSENEYLLRPLDFFRFTPESYEQDAVDFTTGNVDGKYFSLDGGETEIAPLSEGIETGGDMQQLSHWEDGLNIGIMDPTGSPGESLEITNEDLIAFDAIGWDLA